MEKQIKNLHDLEKLSQFLVPFLQPNTYLLLQGKLGVGKTTLAQLIAKNLGIKEKITSPTFTICQRYKVENNYFLNHFDFFRLNAGDNLDAFQELTIDSLNIIEWPEKNPHFWQGKKIIHLRIVKKNSETRLITFFTSSSITDFLEI